MNVAKREKLRENEYNKKLTRISQLEEELKQNLDELKNKQQDIKAKDKNLEDKNAKINEKETRMKLLVEDEKRRSATSIQSSSKVLRTEIAHLKDDNSKLEKKFRELDAYNVESKTTAKELEKTQSLLRDSRNSNETLLRKVLEVEAKLAEGIKAQSFYKTAFESAEVNIQKLTEENNRNKSNQILEQKDEIQRLRSELMIVSQKNEEKLAKFSVLGTNSQLVARTDSYIPTPLALASTTSSEATSVIPATFTKNVIKKVSNDNVINFGKHPASVEKQYIDVKEHIAMLQKEKAMFLKTRVYNEEDPIVKQLNEKIEGLLKIRQQS